MTPSHGWTALASTMRFMLVLFPLFMQVRQRGHQLRVNALTLICSLALLALQSAIVVNGGSVA